MRGAAETHRQMVWPAQYPSVSSEEVINESSSMKEEATNEVSGIAGE